MQLAAGLVLYRRSARGVELFLAHLGGPYFARKDNHGWVVPKGLIEKGEALIESAKREWEEETGQPAPLGTYQTLPVIKQAGKRNHLFLVEGDVDPGACHSNTFALEWPPRSGQTQTFPEVDRYAWIPLSAVEQKLVKALQLLPQLVHEALSR